MKGHDIYAEFAEIFSEIFHHSDSAFNGNLEDLDSLNNVTLLLACEERWGIRFTSREVDSIRSLENLASCIAMKRNAVFVTI